jgi:hypothetical protein
VERQQHPCAVTGHAIRCPCAAVRDGGKPGKRAIDELAGRTPRRVGDEADAAGVALEGPIVEKRVRSQVSCLSGSNDEREGRASRRCDVS